MKSIQPSGHTVVASLSHTNLMLAHVRISVSFALATPNLFLSFRHDSGWSLFEASCCCCCCSCCRDSFEMLLCPNWTLSWKTVFLFLSLPRERPSLTFFVTISASSKDKKRIFTQFWKLFNVSFNFGNFSELHLPKLPPKVTEF